MQKEIFFTPEEMQMIRVCLHNAPIPYDQGKGAKELKVLQEKVGPPKSRKVKGETLVKLLEKLIDTINVMTHPTPAGPSSIPENVVDFNAIKTELRTILSSQNFTV